MFLHCKSVFADAFRHQNVWRRGRIFVSICEWDRESVCVCVGIHSDYRLWYSASSLTLVYAIHYCRWERVRDGSKSSGGKVRGCLLSQKRCHLHKLAAPEKRRETLCDNQSNIHRGWRKRSSRGGRNVWVTGEYGEQWQGRGGRGWWEDVGKQMLRWICALSIRWYVWTWTAVPPHKGSLCLELEPNIIIQNVCKD